MSRFTTTPRSRSSSATEAAGLLAAAALLTACAGYNPGELAAGASEAEVRARMGQPTGRQALPGGAIRLEYARGPMGKHTYMIELDASGRVLGWEQVLTERRFDTIAPGTAHAALRERLGRPSEIRAGWRGVGEVWSYRFESPFCRWFQVWLVDDRVRETSYASDPVCDEALRKND